MPANESLVAKVLDSALVPHGFTHSANFWTRNYPPIQVVFELQKSKWDRSLYINLGVVIDGPPTRKVPRREAWDVYGRVGGDNEAICESLDLGSNLSDGERERRLNALLIPVMVSLASSFSSVESAELFLGNAKGYLYTEKIQKRFRLQKNTDTGQVGIRSVEIKPAQFL